MKAYLTFSFSQDPPELSNTLPLLIQSFAFLRYSLAKKWPWQNYLSNVNPVSNDLILVLSLLLKPWWWLVLIPLHLHTCILLMTHYFCRPRTEETNRMCPISWFVHYTTSKSDWSIISIQWVAIKMCPCVHTEMAFCHHLLSLHVRMSMHHYSCHKKTIMIFSLPLSWSL